MASNYVYANSIKKNSVEMGSILFWIMFGLLGYFVLCKPFDTALFNGYTPQYEKPIYAAALLSGFLFIVIVIYLFQKYELFAVRDIMLLAIWLLPISYLVSSIHPASPHLASDMNKISIMYVILFMAASLISRVQVGRQMLPLVITVSGYIVVWYGFLNMFGNLYFRDAIMPFDPIFRLTSVFQYPNAYASYLIAIMLSCIYYINYTKRWMGSLAHAFMLFPISLSFWMTMSRGALIIIPIIIVLVLPLMKFRKQIVYLIQLGLGLGIGLFLSDPMYSIAMKILKMRKVHEDGSAILFPLWDHKVIVAWMVVLGISLVTASILIAVRFFGEKASFRFLEKNRLLYRMILPIFTIFSVVLMAILVFTQLKSVFPKALSSRLDNINFQDSSVIDRSYYYKDALKVLKSDPIVGHGGGAWAVMYEKFQSFPYTSRQIHNFFLQHLVETGIIGSCIFFILLLSILYSFYRRAFQSDSSSELTEGPSLVYVLISISLLTHSLLDFEMSYVYLASLVFICLGGISATAEGKLPTISLLSKVRFKRIIVPSVFAVVSVICMVQFYNSYMADKEYREARSVLNSKQPQLEVVLKPLDHAISLNKENPDYQVLRASLLIQAYKQSKNENYYAAAKSYLEQLNDSEPYSLVVKDALYACYMAKNDYKAAVAVLNESITQIPWEISSYEKEIMIFNQQGISAYNAQNKDELSSSISNIDIVLGKIDEKVKYIQSLRKGIVIEKFFGETPRMNFAKGQLMLLQGDTEHAVSYLGQAAKSVNMDTISKSDDKETGLMYISWYLAGLSLTNSQDQELYQKLIALDSNEKGKIDQLVASLKQK